MIRILILPFIILEFLRVSSVLAIHIIAMMILKLSLNLGELITLTVFGVFGVCEYNAGRIYYVLNL